MSHTTRTIVVLAAFAVLWVVAPPAPAMAGERDEGSVTVRFPDDDSIGVALKCGHVELHSATLEGKPSKEDIHKARHDKDETSRLKWEFEVENTGEHARKVTIHVTIFSAEDEVLAKGERSGTVHGETEFDHITAWTEIHNYEFPKAHHMLISATCERD
jgi:hypothetical protein